MNNKMKRSKLTTNKIRHSETPLKKGKKRARSLRLNSIAIGLQTSVEPIME